MVWRRVLAFFYVTHRHVFVIAQTTTPAAASPPASFCHLQAGLQNGSVLVSDVLAGTHLVVATGLWDQFFLRKDPLTSELYGFERDLLDEFARRAKFTYDLVISDLPPNRSKFDAWLFEKTGEVNMVTSGYWTITATRLRVGLDTPFGFHDSTLVFASSRNTIEDKQSFWTRFWHFAQPFGNRTWAGIICCVIVTGFLFWCIDGEAVHPCSLLNLLHEVFQVAYQLTAAGSRRPASWASRILLLSWSWCVILILAAYTANLASFLVASSASTVEFKSLPDAINKAKVVCMLDGANVDWVKRTYPSYNKLRVFGNDDDLVNAMSGKECDGVLVLRLKYHQLVRYPKLADRCKLQVLGDTVLPRKSGWVIRGAVSSRCSTILRRALGYHYVAMAHDGTAEKLLEQNLNVMAPPCQDQGGGGGGGGGNSSLDLPDMSGILIIHAIGCALSLLVAILTKLHRHASKAVKSKHGKDMPQHTSISSGSAVAMEDTQLPPSTWQERRLEHMREVPQSTIIGVMSVVAAETRSMSLKQNSKSGLQTQQV